MTSTAPVPTTLRVGVVRGTALFVAAIAGPGILTLPALAADRAGPASLLALGLLLAMSGPVAFTFAALHRAAPGAHGVAGFAAAAFGAGAGRLVTAWFRYGVPVGIPALGLIGGQYVARATGTGESVAVAVATAICAVAVIVSVRGSGPGGRVTLFLALLLVALLLATAIVSLPHGRVGHFVPVAPHGWAAVAGSVLVLTWVLTGWEAVTNFTDVLRSPRQTLPRVTAATLLVVTLLYAAVAVPEIAVLGPTAGGTEAPVAELLSVAVGPAGAAVAALVAVVVATGNSVAWVASLAAQRTAGSLATPALIMAGSLVVVALSPAGTTHLVSICAGAQVPVYLVGLAAGVRLLPVRTRGWWCAVVATVAASTLLISAGPYLLAPAVIATVTLVTRRPAAGHSGLCRAVHSRNGAVGSST